jgi:D-tyrosyl-tRNA(Tyr) deacylase
MRAVVQRVSNASVEINDATTGKIGAGLLVLLGVSNQDTEKDVLFMADKVINLRIFPDKDDKMNLSVKDMGGEILVVSQFTLYGDCRKGRRPSYNDAAMPEKARERYEHFIDTIKESGLKVATGEFQAMMQVSLVNNGPVTILVDSEKQF